MLTCLALFAVASGVPEVKTFAVDGVERQALVVTPAGAGPHPLVLAFHGHGGTMRNAARSFDVAARWPEAIVVYPQGLPIKGMNDPKGERNGWQQRDGEEGDRDLKFVDEMLAKTPNVDPKRVYSMGHSNGGRFTYVLWATRGDRFAAYSPSGSPAGLLARRFAPASAFVIAGEKDPIVNYRSQARSIGMLRTLLGVDTGKAKKSGYTTLAPGKDGLELGTYIHPGGHEYPREAAAGAVALFKRHPKR
ncbi:esterase [bacterium]|nr:MAG: esterase [bacterium]